MDAQRKVKPEAPAKLDVPDELVCPICKKLVKDAVIIQCCSESFCYECIQEYLCENEFICPLCKAEDVSPETLVPNKALRTVSDTSQTLYKCSMHACCNYCYRRSGNFRVKKLSNDKFSCKKNFQIYGIMLFVSLNLHYELQIL